MAVFEDGVLVRVCPHGGDVDGVCLHHHGRKPESITKEPEWGGYEQEPPVSVAELAAYAAQLTAMQEARCG